MRVWQVPAWCFFAAGQFKHISINPYSRRYVPFHFRSLSCWSLGTGPFKSKAGRPSFPFLGWPHPQTLPLYMEPGSFRRRALEDCPTFPILDVGSQAMNLKA